MKLSVFCVIAVLLLLTSALIVAEDTRQLHENKQELQKIKQQLEDTRHKVDSLKLLEDQLQNAIGKYDKRVSSNKREVSRLERHLTTVRADLTANSQLLENAQDRLVNKREHFEALVVEYYKSRNRQTIFDQWDYESHLNRNRRLHYLSMVSGRSVEELTVVGDSLQFLATFIDSLETTGKQLKQQRAEKRSRINLDLTLKEKEQSSLGNVRKQANRLQDRLVSLSEVARQMEDIIAQLEESLARRRQESPPVRFMPGAFAQLKGSLSPPVPGNIVTTFGWKTDKITNLKSFTPGVDIQPKVKRSGVRACAPGRVAYIGKLRGYNQFVILEHDDGYYTTYAGLESVAVMLDDMAMTGEMLGTAGDSVVRFELRKGREHLDPVIWLDLDEI